MMRKNKPAERPKVAAMGECRILLRDHFIFKNRRQAAQRLVPELAFLRGLHPVILGIPRGGLVTAIEIAIGLDAQMDLVMTHKIGAPGYGELAVGAVTETGKTFVDQKIRPSISTRYLISESQRQKEALVRRMADYRRVLPRIDLRGRNVVVTDDGVATGFTMEAALWAVRQEHPARLIAAIPVAPESTLRRLAEHADETICLQAPEAFGAVGEFYEEFGQVQDGEVAEILEQEARRRLPLKAA